VNAGFPDLRDRIEAVRCAIDRAAARSGRDAKTIRLIAAIKTVAADVVREAVGLGLVDLGQNRVQEAEATIAIVGREAARWHMIGHVQRNKAGRIVELFDCVHGVDTFTAALALSRRAQEASRRPDVLIEVNVGGESSKFGVAPGDLEPLLESVAPLPGLALRGLMTVGRPVRAAEDARPDFARLRALRDAAEARVGFTLPELSMGMSGDYEVAVEEGATMVRVGTALFGPRAEVPRCS
jgi:PLP dependent protein